MSDKLPVEHKKTFVYIGKKYFFCSGKCSINPKPYNLIFTICTLTYDLVHTFYYINKFLHDIKITILFTSLSILQIMLALLTALIDPGSLLPSKPEKANDMFATINGKDYSLILCKTCHILKDLRTYHCDDCGLCTIRHDHHCPWLSTCVGLNNHKYFLSFIFINTIFFGFTTCLYTYFTLPINDLKLSLIDLFFVSFLIVSNSGGLAFNVILIYYHTYYICTGQTTRERKKRTRLNQKENPFELPSCFGNLKEFCCYPMRYRNRMNFNDVATKYLYNTLLICDYLSGNFVVTEDKKKISKTLIDKGLSYPSYLLEMANLQPFKLDDDTSDDNSEKLTQSESIVK